MATLILGCGYLGRRVAEQLLDERSGGRDSTAGNIYAVTRKSEHAAELEQLGLTPVVADVTDPASLKTLPPADTVIVAIGYDRSTGLSIDETYVNGLANVLDSLTLKTKRIIYVSSTGVYGQSDGSLLDEESPCEPIRDGGKACLGAEQLLASHPLGKNSVILRLAGIYGPGRLPRSTQLMEEQRLPVDPDTFLNLIHVEDAAAAVCAAAKLPVSESPRIYCVSDGSPLLRRDYFEELARQVAAPPPVFSVSQDARKERGGGHKRISNVKMMAELGLKLRFPDWRHGLAASLAAENTA